MCVISIYIRRKIWTGDATIMPHVELTWEEVKNHFRSAVVHVNCKDAQVMVGLFLLLFLRDLD
jgi:hypothetical protein